MKTALIAVGCFLILIVVMIALGLRSKEQIPSISDVMNAEEIYQRQVRNREPALQPDRPKIPAE